MSQSNRRQEGGRNEPGRNYFTQEERETYKIKLSKAREMALNELLLDKNLVQERMDQLAYLIDPRTGCPHTAWVLPFDKVIKIVAEGKGKDKGKDESRSDVIEIEGSQFSRYRFYKHGQFQNDLKEYYHDVCKRGSTVFYNTRKIHGITEGHKYETRFFLKIFIN